MAEFDADVRAYYERGEEIERLRGGFPSGPLERERTKEIIHRYLPPPPLDILDVGGGPGVYAAWLADLGYRVRLIDPVLLHVTQALSAHSGITAEVGEARQLLQGSASADVVLLLGPLYHLVDRKERLRALQEARRVLRQGGWLFAAAISRYAALLDLLIRAERLHEPELFEVVHDAVQNGVFRGTTNNLFTTAYFHLPREFGEEVVEAGFDLSALLGVEGPGSLVHDFPSSWADPVKRETILKAARLVESKPEMLATSSHLLAVARRS